VQEGDHEAKNEEGEKVCEDGGGSGNITIGVGEGDETRRYAEGESRTGESEDAGGGVNSSTGTGVGTSVEALGRKSGVDRRGQKVENEGVGGRLGRKGRGGGEHAPWTGEGGTVTEGREGGGEGGSAGGAGEKVTEELINKVHMQLQNVCFGICPPPLQEYIHLE
jgi:hypothetical protein